MPSYRAPVEDTLFLLNDVLGLDALGGLPGFADIDRDVLEAVLREGARFCEEQLQPLNVTGDREGCRLEPDGTVRTPEGFRQAYRAYVEAGWVGLSADPAFGGQGLPYVVTAVMNEFVSSANMALGMVPGLSMGAIAALQVHGSQAQKSTYLPPMIEGRWTGTMNLTEPHCGTDLGLIRTRAVPRPDGSFSITGTKIFISAGEHDLSENIVHLVLARIEGAPAGTKGISLFVVPKFIPDEAGAPGARNALACGSLEHKMGIHGNATCVMNYDGAQGWLVGEPGRGLQAMFTMMNEARLAVGTQGLALSEVAYQNAVAYARDRLQGRALTGPKVPDRAADPIIVHPDIRRALLTIRAFNEAGRALVLWTALKSDVAHRSGDEAERRAADDMLGLMTPVIKGVLTDRGFENTVAAQQVFGGHGYIGDWGMEQFVRDARITMIYEGANGIQALDLVGRKLPRDGGRAVMAFFGEVEGFLRGHAEATDLAFATAPLGKAVGDLKQATMWFMTNAMAKPDNAGAGATDYMHLFGLVALGYMWARIAKAALASPDPALREGKLVTARFFMERCLPETATRLARITAGSDTVMALPAEAF
jgi:alkylation response protein AidB-like acyl-CoA dehydrogenase